MKKSIVLSVASIVAVFGLAALPASAAERAAKPAASLMPPHEIITIVRSAGLNPVGKPTRKGMNYLLRAVDDEGVQVRVLVDGRDGQVIEVTPVASNGRDIDPFKASVFDSGVPRNDAGPPNYRSSPPLIVEEEREPPVYRRAAPAVVPPPQERDVVIVPPPRERDAVIVPPVKEREAVVVSPPSTPWTPPQIITPPPPPPEAMVTPPESGDELLPPPPPRFQQRVSATPNTKPVPNSANKPAKTAAKPNAKSDSAKVETAKPNALSSSSAAQPEPPANGKLSPLY